MGSFVIFLGLAALACGIYLMGWHDATEYEHACGEWAARPTGDAPDKRRHNKVNRFTDAARAGWRRVRVYWAR